MAQQNVPASTEVNNPIRKDLKNALCDCLQDRFDVNTWFDLVEQLDDEEVLKFYKQNESYKKCFEPAARNLLSLFFETDVDEEIVKNTTGAFSMFFTGLALAKYYKNKN